MKITTKKEAYNLGYKNAENNIYLPYNLEDELLAEYERGYEDCCINELTEVINKGEKR